MATPSTRMRTVAVPLGWSLLLAVSLVAGRLSRAEGSELAVVWPAAAVTVVWLLRTPAGRARGMVTVGMALVVCAVNRATGLDAGTSLLFTAVNVAHGWVGMVVLDRRGWPTTAFLPRLRDAVTLATASVAASLVSGSLAGVVAAWRFDEALLPSAGLVVARNALSTAVLGAALLALPHRRATAHERCAPLLEWAAIVLLGGLAHVAAFAGMASGHNVAFLLTPVWVVVGARLRPAAATALVTVLAVPTVLATVVGGEGTLAQVSTQERVLVVQAFLAVCALVALGLSVLSGERRAALAEARRRSSELEAYLEASLLAFAVLDVDRGVLTSSNPALTMLLGRPAADLLGTRWHDHVVAEDLPALDTALAALRRGAASSWHGELGHRTADGEVRTTQVALSVVPDEDARVATVQLLDVTERRLAERELAHRVVHDELTGLPNRALLRERLDGALGASCDEVAVLFFDLDHFKAVNDTHGHDVGDLLLVEVARRMAAAVRPGDTVARVGGDEFVVLCPGIGDAASAEAVARRVLEAVRAPVVLRGRPISVGLSGGLAMAGPDDTGTSLLLQSDAALLAAKRQGRDRITRADAVPPQRLPLPASRVG